MKCENARDALLEVDIAELRIGGSSPLGLHLAACDACREMAEAISARHEMFIAEYSRLRPRSSAAAVAEVVFRNVDASTVAVGIKRPGTISRRRRALVGLASLAAAAAITLIVTRIPGTDSRGENVVPPIVAASIDVTVPAGQNAIVFETRNPNITVVWIYSGD